MEAITPKQKETYDFIKAHIKNHGFAPSLVEIAESFHINQASAWERVMHLIEAGYIEKRSNHPRAYKCLV